MGTPARNCTATLRIGASATCEIIDGTGTRLLGPVTADPFNVQNNDPKAEEWKTIKGNCSQEREWSAEAKCVANFNLGGLDEGARHRLVANPATAWIRATFTFSERS